MTRIFVAVAMALSAMTLYAAESERLSDSALAEIHALQQEKASRPAVHRKLDSQFVFELKRSRGQAIAPGVTGLRPSLDRESDGRVLVDIKANVTQSLLDQITRRGGTIIHSAAEFRAIRAQVSLDQLEPLAAQREVTFIHRAAKVAANSGSVTSQGDATHLADFVRTHYRINGSGVKVGVISDGVGLDGTLAGSQQTGELPAITILPGQAGPVTKYEGNAMLQIVHDLAPGAQLYFASGMNGEASFAQNILNLRNNGCQIIVDDLMYSTESPFQDGTIAKAVNTVTSGGTIYVSSAGNEGSLKYGAGTWQGDFVDSGQTLPGYSGRIHRFGSTNYNQVVTSGNWINLFWADPLGASTNDYDLFVLNSTGTQVVFASNNPQTGTQDPFEEVNGSFATARIVVVRKSGAARFLHLNLYRGRLAVTTTGATRGHSSATNAISVAAVNVTNAYPNAFAAGANIRVEPYSSDGPRRVFFHADGTAITPGNFSSTGGALRQKPDLTGADAVSTALYVFNPFNGTSAAAPHVAAIAALIYSVNPTLTGAQIRAMLTNAVLDIEGPGTDINSGAGILMADRALTLFPTPAFLGEAPTFLNETIPNGALDPGEMVTIRLPLRNLSLVPSTNLVATLLNSGGVTLASGPQNYGAIASQGGVVAQDFSFVASGACGGVVTATLQLQDGSVNIPPVRSPFKLGRPRIPLVENFDALPPPSLPPGWTMSSSGAGLGWQTFTNWSDSKSNSVRIPVPGIASDSSLVSPPFVVSSSSIQLKFAHKMSAGAGVLEVATNSGPFLDVLQIGGSFVTNGYSTYSESDGRFVWANNGLPLQTVVNLPASAAGKTLRIRFRFLTADSPFCCPDGFWAIDSVVCNDGAACGSASMNGLTVTAASSADHVYISGNLDFKLSVANAGPGAAAGVSVTNLLPAGFTLQSWNASPGVSLVSTVGNTMLFTIANLAAGEIGTITLSGTANSAGIFSNFTSIARADGGPASISHATSVTTVHPPGIIVGNATLYEETNGVGATALFTISLTAPAATNVTVHFATADLAPLFFEPSIEAATSGQDYVSTNGTLTLPPGVLSRTVAVQLLADDLYEQIETFGMILSAPTNGVLVRSTGYAFIYSNEISPYATFDESSVTIQKPDSGTTNLFVTARLSSVSGTKITESFSTLGNKAIPGLDYFVPSNSITFLPGEITKDIRFVITNHTSAKPAQDFAVQLGASGSRTIVNIITAPTGKADHFTWDPIASPQSNGLPFNVTITARDFDGAPAQGFTGAVSLSAIYARAFRTNSLFGSVSNPETTRFGAYGYSFAPATNLLATHLRAYLPSLPGTTNSLTASLWTETGSLLASLDLVRTGNLAWVERPLVTPIELIEGHVYRLSLYVSDEGLAASVPATLPRISPDFTIFRAYNGWENTFPDVPILYAQSLPLVDVRYTLGIMSNLAFMPDALTFTSNAWTGAVRVQSPATNVVLMASDAFRHRGVSSSFDVSPFTLPAPSLSQVNLIAGQMQFSWNAFPGAFYQIQTTTNLNNTNFSNSTWENLGAPISATDPRIEYIWPVASDSERYFRLLATPQ